MPENGGKDLIWVIKSIVFQAFSGWFLLSIFLVNNLVIRLLSNPKKGWTLFSWLAKIIWFSLVEDFNIFVFKVSALIANKITSKINLVIKKIFASCFYLLVSSFFFVPNINVKKISKNLSSSIYRIFFCFVSSNHPPY